MKDKLIAEIQRKMLSVLNNEQLLLLQEVLLETLHDVTCVCGERSSEP